jgi:hypothetical protein
MKTIPLTQGQFAIVDDDMYDHLIQFKWNAHYEERMDRFYVTRWKDRMHWHVIGQPIAGHVIDHVNGDTLDNRRANLRVVTYRENMQNRRTHRKGSVAGVGWHSRDKSWRAYADIGGIHRSLGYFKTREEAITARKNWEATL